MGWPGLGCLLPASLSPVGTAGVPEEAVRGHLRARAPRRGETGRLGAALPGGLGEAAAAAVVPEVPVSPTRRQLGDKLRGEGDGT